ncbi:MAG: DUF5675 family protein [Moraxellaceae bacterium]
MDLILQREPSTATTTPGILWFDGKRIAYTLEDVVRPVKIAARTAIPPGTYDLRISLSNRFKKELPEVLAVPGFSGVRIHGGNTHENTEGCPLVGLVRNSPERISNCAPAVAAVMKLIREAKGKPCRLIVKPAEEV